MIACLCLKKLDRFKNLRPLKKREETLTEPARALASPTPKKIFANPKQQLTE